MSKDAEVGYKRPPKASRWKKGQSGNPKGRKKGTRNFKTELLEEIAEIVVVREQGEPKRVTKLRALIKAQMAKAVQGDTAAARFVAGTILQLLDPEPELPEERPLSEDDTRIVENFLKRRRKGGKL